MKNDNLQWNVTPPKPLPGLFKFDMSLDIDTQLHCDELDDDFKTIYTNPIFALDINIMDELLSLEDKKTNLSFFKDEKNIDKEYFSKQNERSEVFCRYETANTLASIIDYGEILKNSFDDINKEDEDVEESYPLFMSHEDNFIMMTGDDVSFNKYENIDDIENTSVIKKVLINDEKYNLVLQNVDDYICINVKEGKAYYSFVKNIHNLKK